MSDELGDFFALPAYKPEEALVALRRSLRECRPLTEQGTGTPVRFTWRGLPAIELARTEGAATLSVALAKRPSQRPDWARRTLASSAEQRQWLDDVRRALKRWDDED
ncbi:hypothetical protein DEH84_15825 [Aquabacterium olei]|uniref:DUF5655 domain-containing protein n=1 Tax=Aquabacterium olei TaxID=1296669 RepID=A0A2U8FUJ5_9BURK|nr:hypothetical protein [Aquabacterium olei]AWI54723.1 hypothetical protein DEH84_15825 [Aquabacterium olei]